MGNGIDRACNKDSLSWTSLLEKMTTVENLPKHEMLHFPLEAVLRTNDNVEEALIKYGSDLYGSVVDEKLRSVLTKVLKMKFDEILTTNYDYDIINEALVLSINKHIILFSTNHK